MPEYSLMEWILIFTAALGDGFLVRTFGQGVGIALTPLLTLAFSPRFALGLLAFYSTLAIFGMARAMWNKWDRRTAFTVMPGMLFGALVGVWIVSVLPDAKLSWIIGLVCLLFALHGSYVELSGRTLKVRNLPLWLGVVVGGLSGISSSIANSGGAVLALFMHSRNFQKTLLLATIWIVFLVINPFRLFFYWQADVLTVSTLVTGAAGLPALWCGLRIGSWAHNKLSGHLFNLMILGIALVGSMKLVLGL